MDISVSCSWSGHLDNFLFHISLNSLNCQCISTWKFSQLTLNPVVLGEAFLTMLLTSCWPGAEYLMLSWDWLMGLHLHTLMGSIYIHWCVPSTHTDGFCLHTLMPTPSTGRESVALKLPLNSFMHNLKRSRTRLISPSPWAASLLGQICKTAFIQNFK